MRYYAIMVRVLSRPISRDMLGGDETMLSLQEALAMQLDEMELLETAYPEVVFDTPDARPLLRTVLDESLERQRLPDQHTEERRLGDILASAPLLSFRCPLPHKEAQLRIRLPRLYPDSPLNATVEGTPQLSLSARTAIAEAASDEATRISGERRKEPQCLQVLGEAMRKATDLVDHESAGGQDQPAGGQRGGLDKIPGAGDGGIASSSTGSPLGCTSGGGRRTDDGRHGDASGNSCGGRRASSASAGFSAAESVFLGRRLIYSHHIIATQKRTGIIKGARELRLGGFSKVGWPGVIVVEGEEASCEEFVGMLRGWRWKHLAVRGEETVPVPDGRTLDQQRLLPLPLEELGEKEGVSALAKRCREAGLGDLFLHFFDDSDEAFFETNRIIICPSHLPLKGTSTQHRIPSTAALSHPKASQPAGRS